MTPEELKKFIREELREAVSEELSKNSHTCVFTDTEQQTAHWLISTFTKEENRGAVSGILTVSRRVYQIINYAIAGGLVYLAFWAISKAGLIKLFTKG